MRLSAPERWNRARRQARRTAGLPRHLLDALGLICEGLASETTKAQREALCERRLVTAKGRVSAKGHKVLAEGYGWTVAQVQERDQTRRGLD